MALYELDCADCLEPTTGRRKDTKYCPSCSLLRVLKYAAKLAKQAPKCRACGEKFRPLNKADYSLCGVCTPEAADRNTGTVPCSLCKAMTTPYSRVPVCLPCLKSPEGRERVFKALRKGQADRKKRNAGKTRRPITRLDVPANRDTQPSRP